MEDMQSKEILWKDRKRTFCGLPWSFTKYSVTEDKLMIDKGVFNKTQEEIRLYRIMDFSLRRTMGQRMFGVGTIHCCSADKSTPEFEIVSIKNSAKVKEMLSDLVEKERDRKHVSGREYMQSEEYGDEMDMNPFD